MKLSILLFLTLLTCDFSTKTDNQGDKTKALVDAKIELFFFPSGFADDESHYAYIISIDGSTLRVGGNYYQEYDDDKKTKTLSEEEINKLNGLIKEIGNFSYSSKEVAKDAWGRKVLINGKLAYEDHGFGTDKVDAEKEWELINYIIELSPLEIELYGFA